MKAVLNSPSKLDFDDITITAKRRYQIIFIGNGHLIANNCYASLSFYFGENPSGIPYSSTYKRLFNAVLASNYKGIWLSANFV